MQTLLYIDLAYHKKTMSANFMLDILKKEYDITFQYFDLDGKSEVLPQRSHYNVLLFWQVFPEKEIVERYDFDKIVFFPMYDAVRGVSDNKWLELKNVLIICYSKILYEKLKNLKLHVKYIQYFPKPEIVTNWGNPSSLFMWQRTKDIHVNYILKLCEDMGIEKLYLHKALDPGHYFIPVFNEKTYQIEYSHWFDNTSTLYQIMQESSIYIAPRLFEGIGMSFLNAMANGRCVIAPDFPTMNEYIVNGETGILYDYYNPPRIERLDILHIQKNTLLYIEEGYNRFKNEKWQILDWLNEKWECSNVGIETDVNLEKLELEKEKRKLAQHCNLFNLWMLLKNRGLSLDIYFKKHGISKIAIYGYGDFARRLGEELDLDGASAKVLYYIDKKLPITESGKEIKKGIDVSIEIDAIIVTVITSYKEIAAELALETDCRILSLAEIIDELL